VLLSLNLKDLQHINYADKRVEQQHKERTARFLERRAKLFAETPCLELKAKFQQDELRICEFYFNNQFLNEIGHNYETFSESIMQEGFPEYFIDFLIEKS